LTFLLQILIFFGSENEKADFIIIPLLSQKEFFLFLVEGLEKKRGLFTLDESIQLSGIGTSVLGDFEEEIKESPEYVFFIA
jgi:hypothetical protein